MTDIGTPHAGGRPPLLTPELLTKAREYLSGCQDSYRIFLEKYEDETQEEIEDEMELEEIERTTKTKRRIGNWMRTQTRLNVELPGIAGLAVHLHIARKTIWDWKTKGEEQDADLLFVEFCNLVEDIMAEQEKRLTSNGLAGSYNPTIAKLILTKHGYSDKTDITSGDKPIQASPESQALASAALDSFLKNNEKKTTNTPGTLSE